MYEDLPKTAARIYAMAEMDNWNTEVRIRVGEFPLRRKVYKQSIAMIFRKKDHYPVAAVWVTDENDKTNIEGCFIAVRLHSTILPYRLPTQKHLLMYLTGETTTEQMKEFALATWIKPETEIVGKHNCPGCSMCDDKWEKKNRGGVADKRRGGGRHEGL